MPLTKYKTGKLPYKHDDRHLLLSKYLSPSLPPPPKEVHWPNPRPLGMLKNDTYGCCVPAAMRHGMMVWRQSNGILYRATDEETIDDYKAVGGFDPNAKLAADGSNPTDQGCSELEEMKYLSRIGVVGAFVLVDKRSHDFIKQAIWLFGGALLGWQLNKSLDEDAQIWEPPSNLIGDNEPGSGGGHGTFAPGYDDDVIGNITWGRRRAASWGYVDDYLDEIWVGVSKYWCENPQKAPNGLDMETLLADLQIVTA